MRFLIYTIIAAISTLLTSPASAQNQTAGSNACNDTNSCLNAIMQNTYGTLQAVNNLPTYLNTLAQLAVSWLAPDTSQSTSQIQSGFATLGSLLVQDSTTQDGLQQQLNADLLGPDATPNRLQNANDIVYSTLLGTPYFSTDPRNPPGKKPTANPPYNYIKNAGGFNIKHVLPGMNWQGRSQDVTKYANYYATVMAIESFNGYVLSNQYADFQNGNSLTSTQLSLVTQASNSTWIAQIATEELGKVLRQLLMFESQAYVLLTQLVQTQKQLLSAQAMTNTLLILNNQNAESLLVARAQGVQPTP